MGMVRGEIAVVGVRRGFRDPVGRVSARWGRCGLDF
jgi:hypothetical protein